MSEDINNLFRNIKLETAKAFVRGEISGLKWVGSCDSLNRSDLIHINNRIEKLQDFVDGKIPAEFDGTVSRPIPDFQKGE